MKDRMARLFGSGRASAQTGEHWLTISDLMAGLMMVFLLISVALMRSAFIDRDRVRNVAVAYQEGQVKIHEALLAEFENDLEEWDADIDEDLTFEFQEPEVLFKAGSSEIRPRFAAILSDFFPRYRRTLGEFDGSIDEVRLEGHTSSEWPSAATEGEAYFHNMRLSQGRTRSVLEYVYALFELPDDRAWVKSKVAAVGFSSSRLVQAGDGSEDAEASRRVLFRVVTNAETQIRKILEE